MVHLQGFYATPYKIYTQQENSSIYKGTANLIGGQGFLMTPQFALIRGFHKDITSYLPWLY